MMRIQKRILTGVVIVAMCGLFSGCNKSEDPFDFEAQLEKEIQQIDDYLDANLITAVEDPSGIRMVITKLGTGLPALSISTIDVDYTGKLFSDGSIFDDGPNTKLTVTSYIPGWQIAFSKLPEGSEAKLYIPSYYGYGNNARDGIPANSTLVFDVKFKDLVQSSSYLQKLASDTAAIDQYLTTKGIFDDVVKESQIRYVITTEGSGAKPALYDRLKISYSIKLLTNDTQPVITLDREPGEFFFSRSVDYVQGMLIGLGKMQEGAKATLYIPSGLAFGVDGGYSNGTMVVPPNANVIIDIELKEIL